MSVDSFFYSRLPYTNVVCELSAWLKYYMMSFCLDPRGAHRGRDCAPQSHHAHSCATSKAHRPWSQSEQPADAEHGTATLHRIILWSVYFWRLQRKTFGSSCLISKLQYHPILLFFQELSELLVSCPFFFNANIIILKANSWTIWEIPLFTILLDEKSWR